ncbi:flagellar basal body-associated FliL family protein [Tindallia californiensis]|uniref:Flagellar protein FliL n=1 Tax=Tindallia californiensis TaxID=159292 RepID=A0A1H3NTL7_9FIRM|nr:flagellar basal body-associated FliL family protein [Tindallia californiensis]SDY91499.1 flagellar FliL protein [Tindallia californiensis]
MELKKIIIIALLAFLITAIIVGGILYLFVFRSTDADSPLPTYEYNLGEFSTNLGNQRSFFNGEIVIETTDSNMIEYFEEKNVVLRDRVIKTLISKTPDDVLTQDGQQELRQELINIISEVVESESITNVYFIDYIVQ